MTKIKAAKIGNTLTVVIDNSIMVNSNLDNKQVARVLELVGRADDIQQHEADELQMITRSLPWPPGA